MSSNDFQLEVLEKLSALTVHQAETTGEVRAIVARLDKLNGSVGRHEQDITALKVSEAHRAGSDSATGTWLRNLAPAGWGVLGGFIVLVLQHAEKLLPFLK